jgi:predicted Zn-dependent protease with MMP-like domain
MLGSDLTAPGPDAAEAGGGDRPRLYASRGRFRRYVRRAIDSLPPRFRAAADNVMVVVEQRPRRDDYAASPDLGRRPLFGIYRGVPLSERTTGYQLATPDVIAIFRRPLLRHCRRRRRLWEEIRRTVLHEFGHYLGLDEGAVEHL